MLDEESADPSPPFSTGEHLEALGMTAANAEHLPAKKDRLAPTLDVELTAKLDETWADIKSRAFEASGEQHNRSPIVEGRSSLKRLRTERSKLRSTRRFAALGRHGVRGITDHNMGSEESSKDKGLGELVAGEKERYQELFIDTNELCQIRKRVQRSLFLRA